MTDAQKREILSLKKTGAKFTAIAMQLGLPLTTVKSFCYRHAEEVHLSICPQCGKRIAQTGNRSRRFCCDMCRVQYWYAHSNEIVRRTSIEAVCPVCQKSFKDYPQRHRKYCSHACYIAARYYGGARHDD